MLHCVAYEALPEDAFEPSGRTSLARRIGFQPVVYTQVWVGLVFRPEGPIRVL